MIADEVAGLPDHDFGKINQCVRGACEYRQVDNAITYNGAIVVVQMPANEIVLVHPNNDAYASLPGDPCRTDESPTAGAVRIVRELTGLEVRLRRELTNFVQEGTPTGTMVAYGYVAEPIGGALLRRGPAGPVATYPVDALPEIVPVRVAIQRVLAAYLADPA